MATWGALQLTLPAFVAAGGGLMLVALAILVAASRGGRLRLPLAAAIGAQGAFNVVLSLLLPDAVASLWIALVLGALALGSLALLVAMLASELPRGRATVAWAALGAALLVSVLEIALVPADYPAPAPPALLRAASLVVTAATYEPFALAATFALRAMGRAETRGWRDLALGFALPASATIGAFLGAGSASSPFAPIGLLCLVWLAVPGRRLVPSVLLTCALLAQVFPRTSPGGYAADLVDALAATVAALLLALAVLRDHVADVRAPSFSVRRGPLAAAALALLFIVAQIAQNFFNAKYGLLMGGVVAGTFLFAAHPLQRALDSLRAPQAHAPRAPPATSASLNAETYRRAVRLAARAGPIGEAEEVELAHIAHELGLNAPEAVRLRHEVARESSKR
ncbi:MAG TPA: hypothetical protein VM370_00450 [Candidatus Thermoplasmatota archaeon]|nr:hypothetical protein [Candidatus Thermoplasmatota archaeon]